MNQQGSSQDVYITYRGFVQTKANGRPQRGHTICFDSGSPKRMWNQSNTTNTVQNMQVATRTPASEIHGKDNRRTLREYDEDVNPVRTLIQETAIAR
jgi:hypothetical protein